MSGQGFDDAQHRVGIGRVRMGLTAQPALWTGPPFTRMLSDMRLRDEDGQSLAEYAMLLSLIAIMAIFALVIFGREIATILSTLGAAI